MKYSDIRNKYTGGTSKAKTDDQSSKKKRSYEDIAGKYGIDHSVDEKYITSFITDANNILQGAGDELEKVGWGNATSAHKSKTSALDDLDLREKNIRRWLNSNKSNLEAETYNSIISALDSYKTGADSIIKAFTDKMNYYSQFDSEDAYNNHLSGWLDPEAEVSAEKVAARKERYQSNQARIAEIESSLKAIAGSWVPNFAEDWFLSDDEKALRDEMERLKAENLQYERTQSVVDDYYVPETEEFLANGAIRDYSNASRDELRTLNANEDYINSLLASGSYIYDEQGNIVNAFSGDIIYAADDLSRAMYKNAKEGNGGGLIDIWLGNEAINYRDQYYNSLVQDKLGMFLSATEDDYAAAVSELSAGAGNVNNTWAQILRDGEALGWKYLKENELNIYYDLLKREGQESAYRYLEAMSTELTRRATQARAEEIDNASVLEKIGLNVASIPMSVFGGAIGLLEDTGNVLQGKDINPYSAAHSWQNDSSAIRESTANDINEATGNASLPWVGTTFGDVYQSVMSFADSALASTVPGGSALLGMNAASSTMKDLYERGASQGQMIGGGFLAGAAETFFESFSIGELKKLKNMDKKAVKGFVDGFVRAVIMGGVEASEEMATEIANTLSDALVMGSQSNWVDLETFAKNVVNAGIGGFISGGLGGGIAAKLNNAQYNKQTKERGQAIIDQGGAETLMDFALGMYGEQGGIKDAKGIKLASKLGDKVTAKNVGNLANYVENTIDSQSEKSFKTALVEKGLSSKVATKVAKYLMGSNELSKEDIATIEGSKRIQTIAKSVLEDSERDMSAAPSRSLQMIPKAEGSQTATVTENATVKEKATETKNEASVAVENADVKTGNADADLTNENVSYVEDIAKDKVSRVKGWSDEAATAMVKGYDGSIDPDRYATAFDLAYEMGANGAPASKLTRALNLGVSETVAFTAYELGRKSSENGESVLNSLSNNGIINTNKSEAKNESGESIRIRNGGKRDGGKNTEGQVSRVEGGTRQAESRGKTARVADSEAARLVNEGREVKVADLGIRGGSVEQTVRLVDKANETTSMKEARKKAEARGLKVKFIVGDNLVIKDRTGEWISVRGYIQGNYVFVRADHSLYTADQIMRHELGHDMIAKGEVDIEAVRERLEKKVGKENVDAVAKAYADAYEGSGMSAEDIWEECICDSLGDMNVFVDYNEASASLLDTMLPDISKAANETKSANKTRGSPEGKASRERFWYPKLTQQEWNLLNRRLDQELQTSDNYIDKYTKWLYADTKGTKVFAIYGIGNGTEATVLYAVGGNGAKVLNDRRIEYESNINRSERNPYKESIERLSLQQHQYGNGVDRNGYDVSRTDKGTGQVSSGSQRGHNGEAVLRDSTQSEVGSKYSSPEEAKASGKVSDAKFSIEFADDIANKQRKFVADGLSRISSEELEQAIQDTAHMVNEMKPYANILPQDKVGKTLVKNGSYDVSVENTTVCIRTLAYNSFVDMVSEKVGRPLTQMESFLVSQKLYEIAKEPQCLYCYVSLDRKAFNGMVIRYTEQRDAAIKAYEEAGKPKIPTKFDAEWSLFKDFLEGRKPTKDMWDRYVGWLNAYNKGERFVSLSDISTEAKRLELVQSGGEVAAQMKDLLRYAQNASHAKKQTQYVAYYDEILKLKPTVIRKLNSHYGLRWYSFSDYSGAFIVENMQQITDAAMRGLKGLSYTKDTDFAEIFAPTGMNINISVYAKKTEGGYEIDAKQSANIEEAIKLREQYPNVGIVVVATDQAGVEWALAQEWSDVVIPFHTVRTGADVAEFYNWQIFNSEQNDTVTDQNLWDAYVNEVGKKKVSKMVYPSEHQNNRETYLSICEQRGLTPRFKSFLDNPGYMKLVNETRQSESQTSPLKATYNLEAAERSFDKFVEKGGYYEGWYNDGIDVDGEAEIVAEDVKAGKKANEVGYGRQDINFDDVAKSRKTNRQHGKASRELDTEDTKFSDRNTASFKGKPFWSGSVSLLDGVIEEVHTIEEAEDADFHHSMYFSQAQVEKMENGENAFFWVDNGKVNGNWRESVPEDIIKKIEEQIVTKNNDIRYSRELDTERVSYAPTFYSHMEKVINDVKLDKMGTSSILNHLKNRGVKDEEIKWSGIETFLEGKKSVTKAELQEFVAGSQLQIEEVMSDVEAWNIVRDGEDYIVKDKDGNILDTWERTQAPDDPDLKGWISLEEGDIVSTLEEIREYTSDWYGKESSRWSQYRLDGGTNYRELVFKMPNAIHSNQAMRVHWGQDAVGILVHARIQDFNVKGKKMLFIEELQSDWHNEGREKGYSTPEYEDAVATANKLSLEHDEIGRTWSKYIASSEFSTDSAEVRKQKYEKHRLEEDAAMWRKIDAQKKVADLKKKGMGDVADAPFRENYHEYVLKRLLRMAAEEGYDSIGWTIADTQSKRWSYDYEKAYQIEYDQEMPKFLRKYGKRWGATVGKSSIDNTEIWSMDITNSMKKSVLYEGQPKYSRELDALEMMQEGSNGEERTPLTNRYILANALETAAQNDIEREKLKQYKQKIDLINSEEQKLHDLENKISELYRKKGPRDNQAIKNLKFEANQASNRINTYDKQLLNLESTKALKGVLEREKAMLRKSLAQKAAQSRKEALDRYRERAAKTQRELMDRYQESRKRGIESRNKTAMRHKIKEVVNDLNNYLLKGTKDKHVPIELQKAVAEALDAVNMDTVGAEERIANKREEMRIAASKGNMEKVEQLVKEIEHIQEMGGNMDAKISRLKTAYDSIINSEDPLVANSHDEVISNTIEKVMEVVEDTPLRDMSLYQLEAVYDMYKMVLHSITAANKAFKAKKSEEISTIANRVMKEIDKLKKRSVYQTKAGEAISSFSWNNEKPIYAFERIGSGTFTEVFNNVRAGEDTWAVDMSEAKEFLEEQKDKYEYDTFDFDKKYKFTSSTGKDFELTLGQIMSLYAYSKRGDQAKDHLKNGGFVFDGLTEVKDTVEKEDKEGKKKKIIERSYLLKDSTAYKLGDDVLGQIIKVLDSKELSGVKDFVDAMQDYLSTVMGEKGNEVSLELYGVKLFKEKNYFPLKSAPQFLERAREQAQGETKIKNKGFTKETKPKAKNPVVLTSFMDVWSSHVNEMSMYHAFTLALEDFYRVYNYKTPASETLDSESVISFLENAHGNASVAYIDQLLKDLNGGARSDPRETVAKSLMANFKKASVIASLSVVIQQPSSIIRAQALVDAKYFVGKKVSSGKHKETWAEVKKYAPVAIIKEMGYFDVGMGQSSTEWLKGEKTWKDKLDDVLSKAPALADEYTWCAIWNAVKRETAHNNPTLKTNSEEFLKLAGERFTEVVTKTQVYDSTLARSANMRSKSALMNMWTAFMAEPTTAINMLSDAIRKGNKRYIARTVGAVYGAVVLNSALVALIYAMRDDDEDETFLEKYLSRFVTEVVDGINPLTYIPFVKDIWSALQGYDIERADMTLITAVIDSLESLIKVASKDTSDMDEAELREHNKALTEAIFGITDNLASLTGLPVKNIRREINGFINLFRTLGRDMDTTAGSLGDIIIGDVKDSVPIWGWLPDESKGDKLYDAIIKGDDTYVDRLKSGYKSESAYDSAIRKALRENDPRIKEAAEARYKGDIAGYMKIAKEIIREGNFKQDDVVAAINSEITEIKKKNGEVETSTPSNKVVSLYKIEDYYAALEGRDDATAYAVKLDLIETDVANGKDRDEAEASFNSKFASHIRELYETGDVTDYKAKDMLVNYGGKSAEEAASKVQYWDFKKQYPDYDLSEEAVNKYYSEVKSSGISVDVYYDYTKQRSGAKGTDLNGDGKTDSGSVKREVMQIINSLPISSYQKDALYYLNGWASSTLYEAPWH